MFSEKVLESTKKHLICKFCNRDYDKRALAYDMLSWCDCAEFQHYSSYKLRDEKAKEFEELETLPDDMAKTSKISRFHYQNDIERVIFPIYRKMIKGAYPIDLKGLEYKYIRALLKLDNVKHNREKFEAYFENI